MTSLATTLGLTPTSPTYGPHYLITHFVYAYILLASRAWKLYYKIDHNVSPRADTAKYGPIAVQKGKLTQSQLNQIIRVENCHANSMEHYPVFVAAVILCQVAGVGNDVVNKLGLSYTVARVLYSAAYILNEKSRGLALVRGVFWWASNIICLRAIWVAGQALNAKVQTGP